MMISFYPTYTFLLNLTTCFLCNNNVKCFLFVYLSNSFYCTCSKYNVLLNLSFKGNRRWASFLDFYCTRSCGQYESMNSSMFIRLYIYFSYRKHQFVARLYSLDTNTYPTKKVFLACLLACLRKKRKLFKVHSHVIKWSVVKGNKKNPQYILCLLYFFQRGKK